MPTTEITTQVTSHRAKELAQSVTAAFQSVRDAEQDVEDAHVSALEARYEWGREVAAAFEESDDARSLKEEIARRIDRTPRWVQQHAQFYHKCEEAFRDYEPSVAGYVAYALDTDRRLSWNAALSWMQDSKDGGGDDDEPIDPTMRKVERNLRDLEESVQELSEKYLERKDDLDADTREAVEGVIMRSNQAIEEARHRKESLPDEERKECDPYRFWVADHACCACGIVDDTVVAHHPEHVYPSQGGMGTKINDFEVVPLCADCHREVENNDETAFWERQTVDPRLVSKRLLVEWNTKITD
jgi:5-methylcytosine-specific restriction endonuclease McrA